MSSFTAKVRRRSCLRSVPPRGSGWVERIAVNNLQDSRADHRPTRYRVVVLTSCKTDLRVLRQSIDE